MRSIKTLCLLVGILLVSFLPARAETANPRIVYTYLGNNYPSVDDAGGDYKPRNHTEYRVIATPRSIELRLGDYGTVDGSREPVEHLVLPLSVSQWSHLMKAADLLPPLNPHHSSLAPEEVPVEAELYAGDNPQRRGFYSDRATVQIHELLKKVFAEQPWIILR